MRIESFTLFAIEYLRQLDQARAKYPTEYQWSPGVDAADVRDKMMQAIIRKSANKDGRAMRATCKVLGIPYTYKGIYAYLGL